MGMDYIGCRPRTDTGRHLHLNWTGHSWLLSLLEQLRCDLTECSGDNSGDRIHARTCRAWGKAIEEVLTTDRIVEAVCADTSYEGDQRTRPVLWDNQTIPLTELLPAHEVSPTAAAVLALAEYFQGWKAEEKFQHLQPLDEDTRN